MEGAKREVNRTATNSFVLDLWVAWVTVMEKPQKGKDKGGVKVDNFLSSSPPLFVVTPLVT